MFRVLMILFSFVIAFFFYELGLILEISGAFILLLSGFFIPIGALAAQKIVKGKSEYDFRNNRLVAFATMGFSVVAFIGCFVFLGLAEH